MSINYHFEVIWSEDDQEFVGICKEFPSLSYLAKTKQEALIGIEHLVHDVADESL